MGIMEKVKGTTGKVEEKIRKESTELIDEQARKAKAKTEELIGKVSKDTTKQGAEVKEAIKGKVTK